MSLVNDMLRDLDARRRDAPTRGVGTEKLVPATERVRASSSGNRTGSLLVVIVLVLVLAVLVYLLVRSELIPTVAPAAPVAVLTEAPPSAAIQVAAEPPAANPPAPEISAGQLQMLEARMQELREQNLQLLAQAQSNAREAATSVQGEPSGVAPVPVVVEPASDNPPGSVEPGIAANAATVVRSPRELSFQERDRLTVQRALEQWSSGQQLGALQTLDMFVYENPEAHQSRETLAKLLIQQGENDRALQAMEIGLRLAPGYAGYRKIKARLLLADNAAHEAVTVLSGTGPAIGDDTEYHDLLATAQLGAQLYDQAALSYQALLSQDNKEGRWWYGLATAFDARNMHQDAATAYEQALAQNNLSPALRQASQQRVREIRQGNYGS